MCEGVCSRSIVSCFKNIADSLGESAYICFTFDNALLPFLSQKLFALSARNYYRWRLNRVALPPAAHPRRIIKVSNITCVISLIVGAIRIRTCTRTQTQNERFSFMSRKTELNIFLSISISLSFLRRLPTRFYERGEKGLRGIDTFDAIKLLHLQIVRGPMD